MKNRNKKPTRYHSHFINNCSGSVIVSFAIMLPLIFICLLASVNYTQKMRTRAQISEASNEASLAIVAMHNKNATSSDIAENERMALRYINYYLNKNIDDNENDANISIQYSSADEEYYVHYNKEFDSVINSQELGKAGEPTSIGNKTDTYGNTRKSYIIEELDIAFIADFSGSMTCPYSNPTCNEYSGSISAAQRVQYMKDAIADVITQFPESNFALIPYDIGVPVQNNEQNLAGGESYSCSVMYKLKPPFDTVDYNFWANKNILYSKWSELKKQNVLNNYLTYDYIGKHENLVFYHLDYYNYSYYANIIGPAKGYNNDMELVNAGLCRLQNPSDAVNVGLARYACGEHNADYPLSPSNRNIVKNEYASVVQLYDYMFSGKYPKVHYSFANTETVDVQGTIDTLFSGMDANTITFNRVIAPAVADFSPYQAMCLSPLYNNKVMTDAMKNMSNTDRFKAASKEIASFKSIPHMVTFDNDDPHHNDKLLTYIQNGQWRPGGGTDTITALLRSVPVMAKGENAKKVMFIITDGEDDSGADELRDHFLDSGVCQTITTGLTSELNKQNNYIEVAAKEAVIHYIKISPNADNITTDSQYENVYGKWFTQCMNNDKQYLHSVSDYQSLLDTLKSIILSETGIFINKN